MGSSRTVSEDIRLLLRLLLSDLDFLSISTEKAYANRKEKHASDGAPRLIIGFNTTVSGLTMSARRRIISNFRSVISKTISASLVSLSAQQQKHASLPRPTAVRVCTPPSFPLSSRSPLSARASPFVPAAHATPSRRQREKDVEQATTSLANAATRLQRFRITFHALEQKRVPLKGPDRGILPNSVRIVSHNINNYKNKHNLTFHFDADIVLLQETRISKLDVEPRIDGFYTVHAHDCQQRGKRGLLLAVRKSLNPVITTISDDPNCLINSIIIGDTNIIVANVYIPYYPQFTSPDPGLERQQGRLVFDENENDPDYDYDDFDYRNAHLLPVAPPPNALKNAADLGVLQREDAIKRVSEAVHRAYEKFPRAAWVLAGDWNPRSPSLPNIRAENAFIQQLSFRFVKPFENNKCVQTRRDAIFTLNLPSTLNAEVNWNNTNFLRCDTGSTQSKVSDHSCFSIAVPISSSVTEHVRRPRPTVPGSDVPAVRWLTSKLAQGILGRKGAHYYAEQGKILSIFHNNLSLALEKHLADNANSPLSINTLTAAASAAGIESKLAIPAHFRQTRVRKTFVTASAETKALTAAADALASDPATDPA